MVRALSLFTFLFGVSRLVGLAKRNALFRLAGLIEDDMFPFFLGHIIPPYDIVSVSRVPPDIHRYLLF